MKIEEIDIDDPRLPMNLLLLADPSEDSIREYLPKSRALLGLIDSDVVAVAIVREQEHDAELMSLAVREEYQKKGFGSQMLDYVKVCLESSGKQVLTVGTGNSSIDQLSFYQKCGFRITAIRKDHFKKYDPPIYENGILCIDQIILSMNLGPQSLAGNTAH